MCARSADAAIKALSDRHQDLVLWDVGDDAVAVLEAIEQMRRLPDYEQLPVVMVAESRWSGLEKKAEAMPHASRCLFKPIDPNALIAVVDQLLWMPSLVQSHRRKGTRPSRAGWTTLDS